MAVSKDVPAPGQSAPATVGAASKLSRPARARRSALLADHPAFLDERSLSFLLQNSVDVVTVLDAAGTMLYKSPSVRRELGYSPDELFGRNVFEFVHPDDAPSVLQMLAQATKHPGAQQTLQVRFRHGDGDWRWLEVIGQSVVDPPDGLSVVLNSRDVTERKWAEALVAMEREVLRLCAQHEPLPLVLDNLAQAVEKQAEGILCSIMLLDEQTGWLIHGAAPNLPQDYVRAIDGLRIGPRAGSCGTAAYLKQAVVVSDIITDPLWSDHRTLALRYDLRACWSVPVIGASGAALGTLACYFSVPRAPGARELRLAEGAARIARVAIERERGEDAIRKAETRYREMFELAVVGIYQASPDGRLLMANPALAELLGYASPAEVVAAVSDMGVQVYVDPARHADLIRLLNQQGMVRGYESSVRRKDGSRIWVSESVRAIRGEDGTLLYYEAMVQDATDRKRAQEQARLAAERLEQVIESASDAIIASDLEHRVVSWNRGAELMFGWSRHEVLGRPSPCLPEDLAGDSAAQRESVIKERQTFANFETERLTRDGRRIPVLVTLAPLVDESGAIVGVVGISKDLTAIRALREQSSRLARLEEREQIAMDLHDGVIQSLYGVVLDLGARTRILRQQRSSLRAGLASTVQELTEVVSSVENCWGSSPADTSRRVRRSCERAHSASAPGDSPAWTTALARSLTTLSAEVRLLERHVATLDESTRDTHAALDEAMARIGGVIDEVREYILGLQIPSFHEQSLHDGLEALARSVEHQAEGRLMLELHVDLSLGYRPDVERNLLFVAREAVSNVVRHAEANHLEIRVMRTRGGTALSVQDDGRGFNPDRAGRRSGDGLRNMAERARMIGGTLVVCSTPGKGAEVRLELPSAMARERT